MKTVKITHPDGMVEMISEKTRDLLVNLGIKQYENRFVPNEIQSAILKVVATTSRRNFHYDAYPNMPFAQYINDFRTVKLQMPRQCGKTTVLKELAKEYGSDALVVTMKQGFRDSYKDTGATVITSDLRNGNWTHLLRGKPAPILILLDEYNYFDTSFNVGKLLAEACFSVCEGKRRKTFVLGLST